MDATYGITTSVSDPQLPDVPASTTNAKPALIDLARTCMDAVKEASADDLADREVDLMLATVKPIWCSTLQDLRPIMTEYRELLIALRKHRDLEAKHVELTEAEKETFSENAAKFGNLEDSLLANCWTQPEVRAYALEFPETAPLRRDCPATIWCRLIEKMNDRTQRFERTLTLRAVDLRAQDFQTGDTNIQFGRDEMRAYIADLLCYYGFKPVDQMFCPLQIAHPLIAGLNFIYSAGNPSWDDAEDEVRRDLTNNKQVLDEVERYPYKPAAQPPRLLSEAEQAEARQRAEAEKDKRFEENVEDVEKMLQWMREDDAKKAKTDPSAQ